MKPNFFKPVILIILIALVLSCEKNDEKPPVLIEFTGNGQEIVTNSSGEVKIHTLIQNEEGDFDVDYNLRVIDKNGNPVEGMTILYNELNGKSLIYGFDESKTYQSFFFYGTPNELNNYASNNISAINNTKLKSTESFTVLAIGLIAAVSYIGYKEVDIILNTYEIQKFYLTDYVKSEDDYFLYCKDFRQIGDLIKARTNVAIGAVSIITTFVSAGSSTTYEIIGDFGLMAADEINGVFLNKAIDAWGINADQLVNKKVGVKVYPVDEEEWASNVKNIFAYYEIELNNPECNIEHVPEEVNYFLDNEELEILEEQGLQINKGLIPPNITGNYYANSLLRNDDYEVYPYSYKFYDQTEDNKIKVTTKGENDSGSGYGAFISGSGNSFSVYIEEDIEVNSGTHTINVKLANIYSGRIEDEGIYDFQIGFVVVDKENDINDELLDVGESRVINETDGFAERVSRFPYESGSKSAALKRNMLVK